MNGEVTINFGIRDDSSEAFDEKALLDDSGFATQVVVGLNPGFASPLSVVELEVN